VSGSARISAPSADSFVALYGDYLTLRAKAAKGRASRAALVALAARLADAVKADAEAVEIATIALSPDDHSRAWADIAHPLERAPRQECADADGRAMRLVERRWMK